MMNRKLLLAGIIIAVLIGVSVLALNTFDKQEEPGLEVNSQSSTSQVATVASCDASTSAISTASAVESAGWTDNVTITTDNENNAFRFESNGLPAYGLADYYLIPNDVGNQPFSDLGADEFTKTSSNDLPETEIDTTITTLPQCVTETVETSLGRIGVVVNGAQLFNDYENMERSIVALDDNVTHDHASFVDECNGHPLQGLDGYHYHGVPTCITEKVDVEGQHSTLLGILEDGFPVYGPQDTNGVKITNAQLDECSGHFGATPEFPNGIYHYHLTDDEAPYSIDCYHGEVDASQSSTQMGPPEGQGPPPR